MLDFEQGAVFRYHYDFGDGWRHTVSVEDFLTLATTPKHGSCIAGERGDRLKMSVEYRDTSGFWISKAIPMIPSLPKPFDGAVVASIPNGSTF